jgi:hypothetical protein
MKKIFVLATMAIFIGTLIISCSKDSVSEILPNANVLLQDGSTTINQATMGTVLGAKYGEMILFTATKIASDDDNKLYVYIDGKNDGTYPVNILPQDLLSFSISDIKTNAVVFRISKDESYLLVEGEITLTNTQKSMTSGTFNGKAIRSNDLISGITLEKINSLYETNLILTGDFRSYSVKF